MTTGEKRRGEDGITPGEFTITRMLTTYITICIGSQNIRR